MCGITGTIGAGPVKDRILNGLSHLEYRGYDSAGIALSDGITLSVTKREGKLHNLTEAVKEDQTPYLSGIGHTRWATHGEPGEKNAHPQTNEEQTIAVVHNGIIENHKELRDRLRAQGYHFTSDTDTEVIAKLLDFYRNDDPLQTVIRTVAELRGAYALGILFAGEDALYAVRHESPLIIGTGDGVQMLASDIPAVLDTTRDVIYLENGDLARITKDTVDIFTQDGTPVERPVRRIDWSLEEATKDGYPHFMLKEIEEQPKTVRQTLESHLKDDSICFEDFALDQKTIEAFSQIWIVACGTAYHAGLIGKTLLERTTGLPVFTQVASEFKYQDPLIGEHSLFILVSQSGETADTLAAMREGKSRGATTLAITNVVGSTLAREADHVLYTRAGREISVASTKAYTAQLTLFLLLSLYLREQRTGSSDEALLLELKNLPEKMQDLLDAPIDYPGIAERLKDRPCAFYFGRLLDHATAMEGALKLKEISYIYTEAFPAGELKHGPIALIEEGTPVIALATQPKLHEKMLSNIAEVRSRGAYVIGIGTADYPELASGCDETLFIPVTDPYFAPLLSVIPTQLIAYHTSVARGIDVDKPRNLAKSVTVE